MSELDVDCDRMWAREYGDELRGRVGCEACRKDEASPCDRGVKGRGCRISGCPSSCSSRRSLLNFSTVSLVSSSCTAISFEGDGSGKLYSCAAIRGGGVAGGVGECERSILERMGRSLRRILPSAAEKHTENLGR